MCYVLCVLFALCCVYAVHCARFLSSILFWSCWTIRCPPIHDLVFSSRWLNSYKSPRPVFIYRTTIRYSLVAAMTAQPLFGTSAARSSSRAFITTIKSLQCAWQQMGTHCIPGVWIASYGKLSLWTFILQAYWCSIHMDMMSATSTASTSSCIVIHPFKSSPTVIPISPSNSIMA